MKLIKGLYSKLFRNRTKPAFCGLQQENSDFFPLPAARRCNFSRGSTASRAAPRRALPVAASPRVPGAAKAERLLDMASHVSSASWREQQLQIPEVPMYWPSGRGPFCRSRAPAAPRCCLPAHRALQQKVWAPHS